MELSKKRKHCLLRSLVSLKNTQRNIDKMKEEKKFVPEIENVFFDKVIGTHVNVFTIL